MTWRSRCDFHVEKTAFSNVATSAPIFSTMWFKIRPSLRLSDLRAGGSSLNQEILELAQDSLRAREAVLPNPDNTPSSFGKSARHQTISGTVAPVLFLPIGPIGHGYITTTGAYLPPKWAQTDLANISREHY
jgi:hypothetical protein